MKCPNTHTCAGVDLVMTERQGVEIDYCPNCRGVWLDRGELDKLMERAAAQAQPPSARRAGPMADYGDRPNAYAPAPHRPDFEDSDYPRGGHAHNGQGYAGGYRKKKSWLNEIFD